MITAHTCALLSRIAYEDSPGHSLARIGFRLITAYDIGGTQAILVTDARSGADALTVLDFRGTSEGEDWRTDARYVKTDFPGGGRVHLGFAQAFDHVRDAIAPDLARRPGWRVFAGHSLGASLALEAAVEWTPDLVHVFGCPRTGNSAFVKRLRCRVNRHENWFDLVTFVPPRTSPRQALHAIGEGRKPTFYRHAGIRVQTSGFGHAIGRYVKATA